jgi:hypothetical protein
MTIVIVLAVIVAIAGLAFVIGGGAKRGRAASAERQLARMLDRDTAERLIKWEMLRDPALTRAQAAKRALERAEYDRGR